MQNQRIQVIDSIRGIAILGILFANIQSFGLPELYDTFPSSQWQSPLDTTVQWGLYIFAHLNFYPMFATLFGISMGFIFKSAFNKGLSPYLVFSKRLVFLLFVGALHAFLIWHQDILLIYALIGFLVLPLYSLRKKTLFLSGLIIWLVPNIIYGGFLYINKAILISNYNALVVDQVISNYKSGFSGILLQNIHDWFQLYNLTSAPFVFINIFPMFLFGLAIVKYNAFSMLLRNQRLQKQLWFTSGIIGFSLKILPILKPDYLLYYHVAESFGGPLIALFYGITVTVLTPKMERLMKLVADVGKMTLTNYFLQSITGFLIFKVFGLYGDFSPVTNLAIAAVILSFGILFSRYWLMNHSHGPIESIWRKATYGQVRNSKGFIVDKRYS